MNQLQPTSKFEPNRDKIKKLEAEFPRFRRIYSEYEMMSEELWVLETEPNSSVPDDFINAVKLQTSYLEDEIEDWLIGRPWEE